MPLRALVAVLLVLPLAAGAFCTQPADKYSVLARRVATAASNEAEVQCIILDAMVPKQRFEFLFPPPIGGMLRRLRQEQSTLCVLGMTHTVDRSGQPKLGKLLNRGVEARIESLLSVPLGNTEGFFSSHTAPLGRTEGAGVPGGGEMVQCSYDATLIGGRRFELLDSADAVLGGQFPPQQPIFPARVRWLDDEDAASVTPELLERSEALAPLVSQWTALVREKRLEKKPEQIEALLADLGPMPSAEDADARALWVAGLACPLPGLNIPPRLELALEFRPAVLGAIGAVDRVEAAHKGIARAIDALRQVPEGWSERMSSP